MVGQGVGKNLLQRGKGNEKQRAEKSWQSSSKRLGRCPGARPYRATYLFQGFGLHSKSNVQLQGKNISKLICISKIPLWLIDAIGLHEIKVTWRHQLGGSYSLGKRLSWNLGDGIGNVAGDTASDTRDDLAGWVPDLFIPSPAMICCSKSHKVMGLRICSQLVFIPIYFQLLQIHKLLETLSLYEVGIFKRQTDLLKEYSFLILIACYKTKKISFLFPLN